MQFNVDSQDEELLIHQEGLTNRPRALFTPHVIRHSSDRTAKRIRVDWHLLSEEDLTFHVALNMFRRARFTSRAYSQRSCARNETDPMDIPSPARTIEASSARVK